MCWVLTMCWALLQALTMNNRSILNKDNLASLQKVKFDYHYDFSNIHKHLWDLFLSHRYRKSIFVFAIKINTFELSLVDVKIFSKLLSNHALFHSLSLDCFVFVKCARYLSVYMKMFYLFWNEYCKGENKKAVLLQLPHGKC